MKILIIGGGELGNHVLQVLVSMHQCTVIEKNEEKCQLLVDMYPHIQVICGSGSDSSMLERARCREQDIVVAMSNHDEVNLVVATLAKYDFGVKQVIARMNEKEHEWLFSSINGVDETINQTQLLVSGMIQVLHSALTTYKYD